MADLVDNRTLSAQIAESLREKIVGRQNILISGGTGTGKTTLLNVLADFIPEEERILLIEETAELNIRKSNLVRFETRREQAGIPAVTVRDLLKAALRHRPDRIIVGLSGSLCTLHANSAQQAIPRFADCVLQSGIELPHRAILANIGNSVDSIVHIARIRGRRSISQILAVQCRDGEITVANDPDC